MSSINPLLTFIFCTVLVSCQGSGEKSVSREPQERDPNVPQMQKIAISSRTEADSLITAGVDVIVVERDYVVARLRQEEVATLRAGGLRAELATESDLVQRLVKVAITDRAQATEMASLGVDIWEVAGDTVVAQAYDKYIRQLEERGLFVKVVEENILNLVKKEQ
ncbi:MAG: hypothetical protein ACE5IY_14385 [bacterium]